MPTKISKSQDYCKKMKCSGTTTWIKSIRYKKVSTKEENNQVKTMEGV